MQAGASSSETGRPFKYQTQASSLDGVNHDSPIAVLLYLLLMTDTPCAKLTSCPLAAEFNVCFFFCDSFFSSSFLGIGPRDSYMLGKHPITELRVNPNLYFEFLFIPEAL